MATHRIYYGKGAQTLTTVPHRDGQPVIVASATYGINDVRHGETSSDYEVVAAGTAATVDPLSTTLLGKVGRNAEDRKAIPLTSSAGVLAGHCYLISSLATGAVELVKIAAVVSENLARAHNEVRGDFATGSTFKGVEVSATFPSDPSADDDNLDGEPWVIVWQFAGITSPIRESIHLERGEEAQLATLADLLELDPYLSVQGGDRISPALALARAHRDFRTDLQLAGASESDVLAGTIGRDAVVYRAAQLCLHHSDTESDQAKAESYGQRYQELRAALQVGSKKPQVVVLDKSETNAVAINPAQLFKAFGW